ncbi:hypothetical protein MNBD_GAMMA06-1174 [hydrothermal vent metagenome]|uniref:Uncharacterized protein n=1 Tax=hydrothermal vent metagenome TaxID=652676 RepID=A0A3B0WJI2_9ZZZZ
MCFKDSEYYRQQLKLMVFIMLVGIFIPTGALSSEKFHAEAWLENIDLKKIETDTEQEVQEDERNIQKNHNPVDPCDRSLDTYNYETSWYDETQIYVNSRFCEPALWFDNFFATDRLFEEGVAGTYIRWRNEFSYGEEEYFNYNPDLNFSVELPGLERRLRLTFDNEDDNVLRDIAPGNQQTTNTLGLQLDVAESARSKFNISVSLSPRIRLRYRYTYPVLQLVTLRLTQEVQREKEINSARTLIDVEKLLENQLFFRSSTEGKFSEKFVGIDWLQAFILYQRLNKKTSLSYEMSANGITEPRALTINYRVGMRFRQNFHRKWLFYEIAPEVTWPITLDEDRLEVIKDRRSKWLIFFRLEVHFGNVTKKRYQDYN